MKERQDMRLEVQYLHHTCQIPIVVLPHPLLHRPHQDQDSQVVLLGVVVEEAVAEVGR